MKLVKGRAKREIIKVPCGRSKAESTGYTHIYTGNGKGKTTAAAGLALRAIDAGWKVFILQFIKAEPSGEMVSLKRLSPGNVRIRCCGRGRFIKGQPSCADVKHAVDGLKVARREMLSGKYGMVILDELCVACSIGLVELEMARDFIAQKPAGVELVLTGRNASGELVALADLVSEIKEVKHYMNNKVPARKGVEY